jgi:predicted metal-dependent phosphoesterase TrpH
VNSLADLHMHTTASDGTMSPQALVNEVLLQQAGMAEPRLRVIAVTDHDTLAGAVTAIDYLRSEHEDADLEILPGVEVTSADGHILALGVHEEIPMGLPARDTIDAIHARGGLAVAAHPFAWFPFLKGLKGIRMQIRDPAVGPLLDAVEIRNANPTETLNNHLAEWVNRCSLGRPEVGGSDSHFQSAVGRAFTVFPGRSASDLLAAVRAGTTRAGGSVYGPVAVWRYARGRVAWKRFCLRDPERRVRHDW